MTLPPLRPPRPGQRDDGDRLHAPRATGG